MIASKRLRWWAFTALLIAGQVFAFVDDRDSRPVGRKLLQHPADATSLMDRLGEVLSIIRSGAPLSKALLPLSGRDWAGFVLSALSLFIAAGGGVGGGGLLIPIYMGVMKLATREAVALSNVTIVGGALANFLVNVGRHHPFRAGPLIDYDICLMMEPSTVLGAMFGTYANKVLPSWITTSLLGALLATMAVKLYKKGSHMWRHESARIAHKQLLQSGGALFNSDFAGGGGGHSGHSSDATTGAGGPTAPLHQSILRIPSERASRRRKLAEQAKRQAKAAAATASATQGSGVAAGIAAAAAAVAAEAAADEAGNGKYGGLNTPLLGSHRRSSHRMREVPEDADGWYETNNSAIGPENNNDHGPDDPDLLDAGDADGDESDGEVELAHGPIIRGSLRAFSRTWSVTHAPALEGEPEPPPQLPLGKMGVLWLIFFVVLTSDLGKGRVPCGSLAYFAIMLAALPAMGLVVWATRRHLVSAHEERLALGVPYAEGEVQWDKRHTVVYPAVSTLAGVVAGMFGVGGGIVKGPLMLAIGVPPDVAAATSATMILFTSLSASVVYISFGALKLDYGAVACALGFVCTLVGQFLVYRLVKLLGRRSIIIFVMVVFMGLSATVVGIESAFITRQAYEDGGMFELRGICN